MNSRCFLWVGALALALVSSSLAWQTPVPAPSSTATTQGDSSQPVAPMIKERAERYYRAVIASDRGSARQFVVPANRDFFDRTQFGMIMVAKAAQVQLAPDGQSATVEMKQTVRLTTIGEPLDISKQDTWRLVDGEWFVEVPDPYTMETPFGKLQGPPDPKQLEKEALRREQRQAAEIDPDVAMKKLAKMEAEEKARAEQQKAAELAAQQAQQPKSAADKNKSGAKKKKSKTDKSKTQAPPPPVPPAATLKN